MYFEFKLRDGEEEMEIGMKLLVVDDEYFFRKALIASIPLEEFGITECLEAENGEVALTLVSKERPDIIFADINMPKMNGLEFIEKVRSMECDAKIIIISGYDDFQYVKKGLRFDVKDYLLKPINEKELFEVLGKVIQAIKEKAMAEMDLCLLEQKVYRNEKIVDEYFIHKLLECRTREEYKFLQEQFVQMYCREFTFVSYSVIVIKMYEHDGEESGLYKFIVSNVMSEKIGGVVENKVYIADDMVIILAMGLTPKELKYMMEQMQECQNLFLNKLKLYTCVGIGNIKEHFWQIRESYLEALEAISSRFYWKENKIVLHGYYDVDRYVLDSKDKNMLERAIYEQNNIESQEILDKIILDIEKFKVSADTYQSIMKDLFDLFSEIKNREDFRLEISAKRDLDFLLLQGKSVINYLEMEDYLRCICKILCESREEKIIVYPEAVKKIIEIVEENYGDSGLSVDRIASDLFMNYNYLCVLFKKNVGYTINDYIMKTRMRKALEFLEKGTVQINELSEQCGYTSVSYFTKCFKKEFGIPPSKYIVHSK